jgi:hypothetical protein
VDDAAVSPRAVPRFGKRPIQVSAGSIWNQTCHACAFFNSRGEEYDGALRAHYEARGRRVVGSGTLRLFVAS